MQLSIRMANFSIGPFLLLFITMHNMMFSFVKFVINGHNIFVLFYLQFSPSVDEEVKQ